MGRHALLAAPATHDAVDPAPTAPTVAEIVARYHADRAAAVDEVPTPAADQPTDDDAGPTAPADPSGPATGSDPRQAAAWNAALRPTDGLQPVRRRRGGDRAADVIASLTAELAASHPSLLEPGVRHRRAAPPTRTPLSARLPRLAVPDWTVLRVPARTPLVLAGAVALTVVVTDQTGLLAADHAAEATTTAGSQLAAATSTVTAAATGQADVTDDRRTGGSRVSRSERSPLPDPAASPAGAAAAAVPTPSAVSTMKPGQTVEGTWVRPSPTGIYNSCFCGRWGTFHEGIDFAAPLGSPILAVGDGVVIDAGPASGFGNWVVIQHPDGDVSIYGHMRYYYVKVGQQVTAGQEIAVVGEEGQSTGPHLHLGIRQGGPQGPYIDPVPWLVARGIDVGVYNENG